MIYKLLTNSEYVFHHMGVPITAPRPGEKYSPTFKMYTSGGEHPEFRIQYHRFETDCPLHPLIQQQPHIAFKVPCLNIAVADRELILAPYYPFKNFRVAMINYYGTPIEFIETNLSEEEIWADESPDSVLYPK